MARLKFFFGNKTAAAGGAQALDGAAAVEATAAGDLSKTDNLAAAPKAVATASGNLSKTDNLSGAAFAGHSVTAHPSSDVLTTGWVSSAGGALYAAVDEAVPSDVDYITNTTNLDWAEIKFSPLAHPSLHVGQSLNYRAWKANATATYAFVYLYCGGTLVTSAIHELTSTSPTNYTLALTEAQASAIADYADLRIKLLVTGATGNFSWFEFVVTEPGVEATGALSVSVPLAGAGLTVATADGAMSISIPLAGSAQGEATATGDLSVTAGGTVDLAAAATATATASGDLSLSIPLSGSAVAQVLAQAGLTHVVSLAGAAASGHTAYARPDGTVDGVGYTPVGAATIHECLNEVTPNDATYIYGSSDSVEVSLQNIPDPGISTGHKVSFRAKTEGGWLAISLMQGATVISSKYYYGNFPAVWTDDSFTLTPAEADAITNYNDLRLALTGLIGTTYYSWATFSVDMPGAEATGTLTQGVALAGGGTASAGAGGNLSINISLSGIAIAEAAASAALSVEGGGAVVDLAGSAQAQASAAGALTHDVPLSGASVVVSSASGGLSHIVPLSGAAASASMATGGLDVGVNLDGAALAQVLASAVLDAEKHLEGAADAEVLAGATLTLRVTLDGAAVAQALAAGALTTYSLLDSATPGWDIGAASRDWTINAAARDWAVSAAARDWSIAA